MLTRRVVACLDVWHGRVVKGVRFEALADIGNPLSIARRAERSGADEIVLLDIAASAEDRDTYLDVVRQIAGRLFIPLIVGGGIRSADDMARALRAGADKVSVNSAAVQRPELLDECARRFGAQCVVASIDARRSGATWVVSTHGGRRATTRDAVTWARECAARGAGEILLTSIDRDGARTGYDLELTRAVSEAVCVPVIASGGAGKAAHLQDVFTHGAADAALVAGILHDSQTTVYQLKGVLARAGIPVRQFA
ncbi:MAG TPA: imidazole glycerol phosphate synthase subunit HisF [Gemmatimonadaceae bacterium]|nr:imidazole glycerol phosphate synthase subunit HisF [Gemmatimonadaceae bacterium]